jgi:hypothetical protein
MLAIGWRVRCAPWRHRQVREHLVAVSSDGTIWLWSRRGYTTHHALTPRQRRRIFELARRESARNAIPAGTRSL